MARQHLTAGPVRGVGSSVSLKVCFPDRTSPLHRACGMFILTKDQLSTFFLVTASACPPSELNCDQKLKAISSVLIKGNTCSH